MYLKLKGDKIKRRKFWIRQPILKRQIKREFWKLIGITWSREIRRRNCTNEKVEKAWAIHLMRAFRLYLQWLVATTDKSYQFKCTVSSMLILECLLSVVIIVVQLHVWILLSQIIWNFPEKFSTAWVPNLAVKFSNSQPAFTCSKSTMEKPEQCVKSVQS